jgi:hypothetical protein
MSSVFPLKLLLEQERASTTAAGRRRLRVARYRGAMALLSDTDVRGTA